MPILVTGATGLLGNNVVRALLERGESVRVLVRTSSARLPLRGLDVEVVYGDISQVKVLNRACQNVSAVIHSAAHVYIGWSGLDTARRVNVEGTRNIATAARDAGAKLIHVSSVDALGIGSEKVPADEESPILGKIECPYVVTKQKAEEVVLDLLETGLQTCIVNPGFMLGPWDWRPSSGKMLLEVAKRFTPVAPKGGCSVCDVRDVTASILSALERGENGRRYILAGNNMSYFDLWRLFAQVAHVRPPRIRAGILCTIGGHCGDMWSRLSDHEPEINSAATAMSNLFHYYSSQRAKTELGYQTRETSQSVRDAWQWFKQNSYA